MILLLTVVMARVSNGMAIPSNDQQVSNEDVLQRFTREPRILNVKMICPSGQVYAENRCRKLLWKVHYFDFSLIYLFIAVKSFYELRKINKI